MREGPRSFLRCNTARLERAHFKEYAVSFLNHEAVYYVLRPEYNTYMDIHHAINMEIYGRFEEEGIEIAYPTRTVHVRTQGDTSTPDDKRRLAAIRRTKP